MNGLKGGQWDVQKGFDTVHRYIHKAIKMALGVQAQTWRSSCVFAPCIIVVGQSGPI